MLKLNIKGYPLSSNDRIQSPTSSICAPIFHTSVSLLVLPIFNLAFQPCWGLPSWLCSTSFCSLFSLTTRRWGLFKPSSIGIADACFSAFQSMTSVISHREKPKVYIFPEFLSLLLASGTCLQEFQGAELFPALSNLFSYFYLFPRHSGIGYSGPCTYSNTYPFIWIGSSVTVPVIFVSL